MNIKGILKKRKTSYDDEESEDVDSDCRSPNKGKWKADVDQNNESDKENMIRKPKLDSNGKSKRMPLLDVSLSCHSCEVCNKVFAYKGGLMLHMRLHTRDDGKVLHCSKCDRKFATKDELEKHMVSHNKVCRFCEKNGWYGVHN